MIEILDESAKAKEFFSKNFGDSGLEFKTRLMEKLDERPE